MAPPAAADPTDLLKQLNLPAADPSVGVSMLMQMDDGQKTATTDPAVSQEALDVACAKAGPCAPGFLCVPETDTDGTLLPPAVADEDFKTKLQAAEDKARAIAMECGARREALHKSVVHTTVGAAFAVRISLLLTAEAVAAQWRVFWLIARIQWIMGWSGLGGVAINAAPTGDQKACNVVFTEEQCKQFADLQALDDLRKMDKKAGKPERLVPLTEKQLKDLLAEQVTAEEQTFVSSLDSPTTANNPFTDATADKPWLDLFADMKKLNVAIMDAKVANDKLDEKDRDPAIVAAVVARNQLAKLALYGTVLHAFNKGAQAFLDADANQQIAAISNIPECSGQNLLSLTQPCKDARLAMLKGIVQKLAESVTKAAQIIELSKVRGAFVWKFVELSGQRAHALWLGVVRCVMFFANHVKAIAAAKLVVAAQITASAPFVAKLDQIRKDWVALNLLVAKVAALPSKKADDLDAADKAALIALALKIKTAHAELWTDLAKAVTAAKVARRVVCRRRLAQTIVFKLRNVCRKSDDEEACKTRVQDYFNGIRQKLIDNKDKLKDAFTQYSDIKDCWPLIRFNITKRVVAGAFKAAAASTAMTDPTQVAMENVSNDPCASLVDGTMCEEVEGEIIVPADCTAVPKTDSMMVVDGSIGAMLAPVNTSPMMRKRAVLADAATADKFATVFGVDAAAGSTFTPSAADAKIDVNAKSYDVAIDASLKQAPSCAELGIAASDPMCKDLPVGTAGPTAAPSGTTGANGGKTDTTNGKGSSSRAASIVVASLCAVVAAVALLI